MIKKGQGKGAFHKAPFALIFVSVVLLVSLIAFLKGWSDHRSSIDHLATVVESPPSDQPSIVFTSPIRIELTVDITLPIEEQKQAANVAGKLYSLLHTSTLSKEDNQQLIYSLCEKRLAQQMVREFTPSLEPVEWEQIRVLTMRSLGGNGYLFFVSGIRKGMVDSGVTIQVRKVADEWKVDSINEN